MSLNPKIGGGSIYTTYLITTRDEFGLEQQEVLKLKNPNAERWVYEMVDQARAVVRDLKVKDRRNLENYQMAERLLDMIKAWVLEDISDESFLDDDEAFTAHHQGFVASNGVRLEFTQTKKPTNSQMRRESLARGETLNMLLRKGREVQGDQRLKKVVQAQLEHLGQQLSRPITLADGTQVYYIHSDIHPGNLIVEENNGVITLKPIDRGYYLKLSEADIQIIKTLILENDDQEKLNRLIEYLVNLPENQSRKAEQQNILSAVHRALVRRKVMGMIAGAFNGNSSAGRGGAGSGAAAVNSVLQEIEKQDLVIPLRMRIMLKNIDAVKRMMKEVVCI